MYVDVCVHECVSLIQLRGSERSIRPDDVITKSVGGGNKLHVGTQLQFMMFVYFMCYYLHFTVAYI